MRQILHTLPALFLLACGGGSAATGPIHVVPVPSAAIADEALYLADADGLGIEELFVARIDGTSTRKVSHPLATSEDVTRYSISPDRKYAAFVVGTTRREEFYIVRLADLQSVQLPLIAEANSGRICWAPDGSRLAVTLAENPQPPIVDELYTVRPDGTGLVRLSASVFDVAQFSWSPDSQRIYFEAKVSETGPARAFAPAADGTSSQEVTPPVHADSFLVGGIFSPDASRVASIVDADVESQYRLYTTRVPGGAAIALTPGVADGVGVDNGAWSPDSKWLAYLTDFNRERYSTALRVVDGTGPGIGRAISPGLASDTSVVAFSWSPDGAAIVYHAHGDAGDELWVTDIGGNAVRITAPGTSRTGTVVWRWSPDSRWIAIVMFDNRVGESSLLLWRRGSAGLAVKVPGSAAASGPLWSPTSERVAVLYGTGNLGTVAVSAPTSITFISDRTGGQATGQTPCRELFTAEWSPDGKTLVYVAGDGASSGLMTRRSDASAAAVVISSPIQRNGSIRGFEFVPIRYPTNALR